MSRVVAALALLLSGAAPGCSGGSGAVDAGTPDLAVCSFRGDWSSECAAQCGGGPQDNICFPDPICQGDKLLCFCQPCMALPVTSSPCSVDSDCPSGTRSGQAPVCLHQTSSNGAPISWPGGYCSSPCRTAQNDTASGINLDCPGGTATCVGAGAVGSCEATCPNFVGVLDCRAGYACFTVGEAEACEPSAKSQCDPTVKGSCLGNGDGGAGMSCVNAGDGTVGACVPACDPFSPGSCIDPRAPDCHASDLTGEGFCSASGGGAPGASCSGLPAGCPDGYGCYSPDPQASTGLCTRYCNAAHPCTTGSCAKLDPFTPVDPLNEIGLCSG